MSPPSPLGVAGGSAADRLGAIAASLKSNGFPKCGFAGHIAARSQGIVVRLTLIEQPGVKMRQAPARTAAVAAVAQKGP